MVGLPPRSWADYQRERAEAADRAGATPALVVTPELLRELLQELDAGSPTGGTQRERRSWRNGVMEALQSIALRAGLPLSWWTEEQERWDLTEAGRRLAREEGDA